MWYANNSAKTDKICPFAFPNQISKISAHTKFSGNRLIFTQVIIRKQKYGRVAGITVKNWRNLSTGNAKPDLHNINAQTKFGENQLIFTQDIVCKWKYGSLSKIDKICSLTLLMLWNNYITDCQCWIFHWKTEEIHLCFSDDHRTIIFQDTGINPISKCSYTKWGIW